MEPIQLNSLVQLHSGGPIMTVASFADKLEAGNPLTAMRITDESRLNCEWFDGTALHQGTFGAALLRTVAEHELGKSLSEEAVVSAYSGPDHA